MTIVDLHIDHLRDEQQRTQAVLRLSGELDMGTEQRLLGAVLAASADESTRRIVADLNDVTFIDSSGIRALVTGAALARGRGIDFTIDGASVRARRLFDLVGVSELLGCAPVDDHVTS